MQLLISVQSVCIIFSYLISTNQYHYFLQRILKKK